VYSPRGTTQIGIKPTHYCTGLYIINNPIQPFFNGESSG